MKNLCVAFRDMPPDGEEVAESGWLTANTCQEIPRHSSIARATLDAWLAESRKGVKK